MWLHTPRLFFAIRLGRLLTIGEGRLYFCLLPRLHPLSRSDAITLRGPARGNPGSGFKVMGDLYHTASVISIDSGNNSSLDFLHVLRYIVSRCGGVEGHALQEVYAPKPKRGLAGIKSGSQLGRDFGMPFAFGCIANWVQPLAHFCAL